eukprot:m.206009 g.206009  ORF g.206009 m.206009 type:complete len:54 (+) comp15422_c0_seq3:1084-1245(+)
MDVVAEDIDGREVASPVSELRCGVCFAIVVSDPGDHMQQVMDLYLQRASVRFP